MLSHLVLLYPISLLKPLLSPLSWFLSKKSQKFLLSPLLLPLKFQMPPWIYPDAQYIDIIQQFIPFQLTSYDRPCKVVEHISLYSLAIFCLRSMEKLFLCYLQLFLLYQLWFIFVYVCAVLCILVLMNNKYETYGNFPDTFIALLFI